MHGTVMNWKCIIYCLQQWNLNRSFLVLPYHILHMWALSWPWKIYSSGNEVDGQAGDIPALTPTVFLPTWLGQQSEHQKTTMKFILVLLLVLLAVVYTLQAPPQRCVCPQGYSPQTYQGKVQCVKKAQGQVFAKPCTWKVCKCPGGYAQSGFNCLRRDPKTGKTIRIPCKLSTSKSQQQVPTN